MSGTKTVIDGLPDFSRVGYREGHIAIPQVPVRVTLLPSSDEADDTTRIQEAIDKVSERDLTPLGNNGIEVRGAVLLKAGVYRVAGALVLHSSGVVLRGEGQGAGGTTVRATGFLKEHQRVDGNPDKVMMPENGYKTPNGPVTPILNIESIHVGDTHIPVESTANFHLGDHIVIERPASKRWIHSIGMDHISPKPNTKPPEQWHPESYTFRFERTILGIDSHSNTIEIDIPMVMTLEPDPDHPDHPPGNIFKLQYKESMISDVGIENMCLDSDHKKNDPDDEDEDHAWYAVVLDNVRNGWVADVTTRHFVSGIFASTWSRFITIQDCSVLEPISKSESGDGRRRYAFNLSGQMGLVKRCFTESARHDFITLSRVCGPNAFVESEGDDATNDTGPHERWAMGTLYDNITCNRIDVQNRASMGTGQGWAGAFQVVYNCTAKEESIIRDAPGTNNWVIGFTGRLDDRPEDDDGVIGIKTASTSTDPKMPRSLYWWQLIKRMGGNSALVQQAVGPFFRKEMGKRR